MRSKFNADSTIQNTTFCSETRVAACRDGGKSTKSSWKFLFVSSLATCNQMKAEAERVGIATDKYTSLECDLADLASVRKFSKSLKAFKGKAASLGSFISAFLALSFHRLLPYWPRAHRLSAPTHPPTCP